MSDARKFRFVSPGIFLNEIDQSQIPALPDNVGPVIIGRTERGPGMVPVRVNSFSEFVEKFGNPIAGRGGTDDVWRDGNYASPTYAAYAAQAYLRSGVGPVTMVRLMGTQSPDVTTGYAGWTTAKAGPDPVTANNGGAYGLFLWDSGAAEAGSDALNGTLAAVWYFDNGGSIALSGNVPQLSTAAGGATGSYGSGSALIVLSDSAGQFKAIVRDSSNSISDKITFSLSESDPNFIRKVFNTNPQRTNTDIESSANQKGYWLGETFERYMTDQSLNTAAYRFGAIAAVVSGTAENGSHDMQMPYRDAHTGWFFAQNRNASYGDYEYGEMEKLFKFVGINGHGAWLQKNIKISIMNIRASSNDVTPYGTFDVLVRKAGDSDLQPAILERYSNCNLNPGSQDYIAVKIGDMKLEWDSAEKRYREEGNYANRSEYIRVVVADLVDNGGASPSLLPFGVYGPPRYPSWTYTSGGLNDAGHTTVAAGQISVSYALGSASVADSVFNVVGPTNLGNQGTEFLYSSGVNWGTASIKYPAVGTRISCSAATADGAVATKNAYFGLHTGKSRTSTVHDPGYPDYLRPFSKDIIADSSWVDTFGDGGYAGLTEQWIFSLDEVCATLGSTWSSTTPSVNVTDAFWESGSYKANRSVNASSSLGLTRFENILDMNINRFTSPMWGGFDGFDITERDPFRNSGIGSTEITDYKYYTLRRAIDTISDAEVVQMNAAAIPGITNESITKYLIDTCEERADALAVIDLKGGYTPRADDTSTNKSASDRKGVLATVISNVKDRNLNSSYGCAYYPWVKIRDDINSTFINMPPSVVALGVLGNTERAADVWFAPAGFQRGGLSQGAGGLPVIGVEQKLTSKNRDDLYDVNVNPIASFPAEGIVVFGQKTLQATPSALDRINVRRLMIFVKRGISRIASETIFQPNVQATWNSFKSKADNFLADVQVRFGVDDFKVVLDETTTTPDLVDRNIMYAKIFVKPTRAIEFIAIDFIITRSGASFED